MLSSFIIKDSFWIFSSYILLPMISYSLLSYSASGLIPLSSVCRIELSYVIWWVLWLLFFLCSLMNYCLRLYTLSLYFLICYLSSFTSLSWPVSSSEPVLAILLSSLCLSFIIFCSFARLCSFCCSSVYIFLYYAFKES